jgi:hypothetical protein
MAAAVNKANEYFFFLTDFIVFFLTVEKDKALLFQKKIYNGISLLCQEKIGHNISCLRNVLMS